MAVCTSSTEKAVDVKKTTNPQIFSRFKFFLCGDNPGSSSILWQNVSFKMISLSLHWFSCPVIIRFLLELKRGKPHPDIYLKGAEMLGVDPKNILVFEDSLTGAKSVFSLITLSFRTQQCFPSSKLSSSSSSPFNPSMDFLRRSNASHSHSGQIRRNASHCNSWQENWREWLSRRCRRDSWFHGRL